MKYRRFTPDFKRSLVEQLLSETATPTELCRRYNISSGQLYTWKRQYAHGKLDPEPSREVELAARVRELERMNGLTTGGCHKSVTFSEGSQQLVIFQANKPPITCVYILYLPKSSGESFSRYFFHFLPRSVLSKASGSPSNCPDFSRT